MDAKNLSKKTIFLVVFHFFKKIGKSWRENFLHFSGQKETFFGGKMSEILTPRFSNF